MQSDDQEDSVSHFALLFLPSAKPTMHLLELNHDILHDLSTFIAPKRDLGHLISTSRAAYDIFVPALYRDVSVSKEKNAAALCSTLLSHPERIDLLRTLKCVTYDLRFLITSYPSNLAEVLFRANNLQVLKLTSVELFDEASSFMPALIQLKQLRSLSLSEITPEQCRALLPQLPPGHLRSINLDVREQLPDVLHLLQPLSASLEDLTLSFRVYWGRALWCSPLELSSSMHWPRVHTLGLIFVYVDHPDMLSQIFPNARSLDIFGQPCEARNGRTPQGTVWHNLKSLEINSFSLACQIVDWQGTGAIDGLFFSEHWLAMNTADFDESPVSNIHTMLASARPKSFLVQIHRELAAPVCSLLQEFALDLDFLALSMRSFNAAEVVLDEAKLVDFIPKGLEKLPIRYFMLNFEDFKTEFMALTALDMPDNRGDNFVIPVLEELVQNCVTTRFPHARFVEFLIKVKRYIWEVLRDEQGVVRLRLVPKEKRLRAMGVAYDIQNDLAIYQVHMQVGTDGFTGRMQREHLALQKFFANIRVSGNP
ncbi:hypothetical protein EVG20_g474 [Dentipellis fragilis]|uniref:F-box domain-containing protein n=1 Tax=Dentipellis fragilis TaxID=205917 RepID=A0A4Y9ZD64_9AGAM|nr:hypothetical protein EVG20_g474 [Dentipellis fragilis]